MGPTCQPACDPGEPGFVRAGCLYGAYLPTRYLLLGASHPTPSSGFGTEPTPSTADYMPSCIQSPAIYARGGGEVPGSLARWQGAGFMLWSLHTSMETALVAGQWRRRRVERPRGSRDVLIAMQQAAWPALAYLANEGGTRSQLEMVGRSDNWCYVLNSLLPPTPGLA